MFGSLFASKNKKLVIKWEKEHKEIVVLAHKVIEAYSKKDEPLVRKELKALNSIAVGHLMNEDIEFYRLLKDQKRLHGDTETMVREFTETFKGTKHALMSFLTKYTQPNAVLDETFFRSFNEIVGVLAKRIAFEEENLYIELSKKV